MAANTFPIYPKTPNTKAYHFGTAGGGVLTSGYTSAGAVSIFVAGTEGAYLKSIAACALGDNDAGKICLFLDDLANINMFGEIPVEASVASTTERNAPPMDLLELCDKAGGFGMQAGHRILIATTAAMATGYSAVPFGGDY